MIAAVAGGNIALWNLHGYLIKELELSSSPITALTFSQDGKAITAAHQNGAIINYNTYTGKILRVFSKPGNPATTCLTASRTGHGLIAGATDGTLRSWNHNSGRLLWKITAHGGPVSGVSISDQGDLIVSSSKEAKPSAKLWDSNGAGIGSYSKGDFCNTAVISPDGRTIAVANSDRSLLLLDLNLQTIGRADLGPRSQASCIPLKFSPDGKNLAVVSPMADRVWIYETAAPAKTSKAAQVPPLQLKKVLDLGDGPWDWNLSSPIDASFSPDSRFLVLNLLKKDSKAPGTLSVAPTIMILDVTAGYVLKTMRNMNEYSRAADISPDGNKMVSGSYSMATKLWSLDGRLLTRLDGAGTAVDSVAFSRDGTKILVTGEAGQALLLDTEGKVLKSYVAMTWHAPAALSWDNRLIARFISRSITADPQKDKYIRVEEIESGKVLAEIPVTPPVRTLFFDPSGKYLIWPDGIWDIGAGNLKNDFGKNYYSAISSGGALLATYGPDGVKIRDMEGNILRSFVPSSGSPRSLIKLDESGTQLAISEDHGTIEIWDPAGPRLLRTLEGHTEDVTSLAFSRDGRFLVSAGEDDSIRLWSTANGQSFSLYTNKDEWLIHTPDGYFDASPHGEELAAVVIGSEAYGIEQFSARYNRPDLILERMGVGSPEAVSHYQALYQKRLKRLELTEGGPAAETHVPSAEIRDSQRNGKDIILSIRLADQKYPLKRYNIYVNNVPLLGPYGRKISGKTLNISQKVELTPGRNKIEVSATNSTGVESYRALTYADYSGTEKGELYYLAFGASKYKDATLNLEYADKDVRDMRAIVQKMRPAYAGLHTKTFLNAGVTSASLKEAKRFLQKAGTDDTVILHIAGHGGYNRGKDNKYYFMAHETDVNDLAATGIDFESLEDLLSGIKPRRKLFLMDTCDSGELEEETLSDYYEKAGARGLIPRTYRKPGLSREARAGAGQTLLYTKDRFIHNNLSRRSGAVVLSSSRGGEISYESSLIKNGFFTREVINALTSKSADKNKNGKIDTDELRDFVAEAVARDTAGLQHPTIDRDNLYQEIEFPLLESH